MDTMHALYSTILPPSSIHHSLFLSHFTPSTIYPIPQPHVAIEGPEVKVIGNLIVAGGQDLRVFEIREEASPIRDERTDEPINQDGDLGDSFFDAAPADVSTTIGLGRMHCIYTHTATARYRELLFDTRLRRGCNSSLNINFTERLLV